MHLNLCISGFSFPILLQMISAVDRDTLWSVSVVHSLLVLLDFSNIDSCKIPLTSQSRNCSRPITCIVSYIFQNYWLKHFDEFNIIYSEYLQNRSLAEIILFCATVVAQSSPKVSLIIYMRSYLMYRNTVVIQGQCLFVCLLFLFPHGKFHFSNVV